VGRYEADPCQQFDFLYTMTLASIERSLQRLQCEYIDVIQLHDPEFAPSLDILLQETLPAMLEAQRRGWCRALGITGYPLEVQHQIMEASIQVFGRMIFDQALTYSHCNLHDTSLLYSKAYPGPTAMLREAGEVGPTDSEDDGGDSESCTTLVSFVDYCRHHKVVVLNAAPLSMGLLTTQGPPSWHPASADLKQACRQAYAICCSSSSTASDASAVSSTSAISQEQDTSQNSATTNDSSKTVNLAHLAILMALAVPPQQVVCTILGMASPDLIEEACGLSRRIEQSLTSKGLLDAPNATVKHSLSDTRSTIQSVLQEAMTASEYEAYKQIVDDKHGPFAQLWRNGGYCWDGVEGAQAFWRQLCQEGEVPDWQAKGGMKK
jgi:aryl-alcohol dehydrogenase-like predicted oxidoreductase